MAVYFLPIHIVGYCIHFKVYLKVLWNGKLCSLSIFCIDHVYHCGETDLHLARCLHCRASVS
jgi:hypothetical protein